MVELKIIPALSDIGWVTKGDVFSTIKTYVDVCSVLLLDYVGGPVAPPTGCISYWKKQRKKQQWQTVHCETILQYV